MKKRIASFAILLSVLISLMSFSAPVFASNVMDVDAECSLVINCHDPKAGFPLVGVEFSVYLVAKPGGSGYELTGSFGNMSREINGLDSEGMVELTKELEAYAAINGISPTATTRSDDGGAARFSGLETGLYLVRGAKHSQGGVDYNITSVFVYLPSYDGESGTWDYDMVLYAKCIPESDDEEFTKINVKKIWKDDGKNRPEKIIVHLLRGGETYDTVELSEENGWEYTWDNLEKDSYYIFEEVPVGYTAEVVKKGNTYVITNTNEPPTPPPPPPDLPQTGQLWWPIPLLAAVGIALLVAGMVRKRGGCNES